MKKRVYLVDDHPLVREWLKTLIDQQADLIVCGESGEAPEALQGIMATEPDAAVIDLTLSCGSGLELTKSVRKAVPKTAVVALTMHDESLYAERALRAGAWGYVTKRDATKRILPAIRRVMDGKIYVSDEFAATMTARFVGGDAPAGHSLVGQLSDRELEVYRLLGEGRQTWDIGGMLGISPKTVQVYYSRIKEKLGYDTMNEMLREAVRAREAEERGG
jgi:DNA-binding NarL/FixJ family response regulator